MILLIAIILGSIALDQLTKWLAVAFLEGQPSFPIWQDVLHLTLAKNEGAAFGMLSDHRWVFMIFSTVAIIGLLIYLFRFPPKSRYVQITLAMIVGGGIGNMIDRVRLEYVIDFIDFCAFPFWTWIFNVADAFVVVGCGLAVLSMILDEIKEHKKKKATAEATHAENNA